MSIWISILIILISLYIMSEVVDKYFIKSLDNIARWLKMPESVAGATLLAFGTSTPEISTALFSLFLEGANPATGIGTIVGSAIFQILVVIGFAAFVRTSQLNWKPIARDGFFYAVSIAMLLWFIRDDKLTFYEALSFVCFYVFYLFCLFLWTKFVEEVDITEKNSEIQIPQPLLSIEKGLLEHAQNPPRKNVFVMLRKTINYPIDLVLGVLPDVEKHEKWTIPVFLISLGIIGYSCYWLVIAAEQFAGILGIPPAIVALTILAGGTSIPEMISSAIVSKQGRGDMAIANAIGSNIFDILMSLGLPVLIYILIKGNSLDNLGGSQISSSVFLLFFSLILVLVLLIILRFRATRLFGGFLMTLYAVYVLGAYQSWF